MNIVTQKLIQLIDDRDLYEFVTRWDDLEDLVVSIYREDSISLEDEAEYQQLRGWLNRKYLDWMDDLRPYWHRATIEGKPVNEDPFEKLLAVENAMGFRGNWNAMRTLPAAREALNNYLLSIIEE